jgi:hypothetical protein
MGVFFHFFQFCATDLNFGTKNNGRMKNSTLKILIFASYWGPELVRSSCYGKNIGAEFTHLYIPLLCLETFVIRHIRGHYIRGQYIRGHSNSWFIKLLFLLHAKILAVSLFWAKKVYFKEKKISLLCSSILMWIQ